MKKTLIALLALGSLAMGEDWTLSGDSFALNGGKGTILGGSSNTATETASAITGTSDWATLTTQMANTDTWYVTSGKNWDVGMDSNANAVVYVAGGPHNKGYTAAAGMKFDLADYVVLDTLEGPLTLTFDLYRHAGNNNSNHDITFSLVGNGVSDTSVTYNSKEGDYLISTDAANPTSVTLTLDVAEVSDLVAGGKSELVFLASSSDVFGSNTGFAMTNFTLTGTGELSVPEPTTATLSLLALAGLAARRRRK